MRQSNGRLILGVILVAIGVLYMADNFLIFPWHLRNVIFSWPAIVVIVGLVMLLNSRDSSAGLFLIVIGGALLVFRYYHIPFSQIFAEYWPVLLILMGLFILIKPSSRISQQEFKKHAGIDEPKTTGTGNENHGINTDEDMVNEVAILSGAERRFYSSNFRGGKVTAVFGAAEIDLRDAKIAEGRQIIDVMAVFGGVEISVPKNWRVIVSATSIFGGIDDARRKDSSITYDESGVLEIRGTVLFAGIDLKN